MSELMVRIEPYKEIILYGLWRKANDKTVAKDITDLSSTYHQVTATQHGAVLPFFVLSRNYHPDSQDFELYIGSLTPGVSLEKLVLPEGQYAVITVKPKFGFLWGLAVGEAKRYFYTQWLPASTCQAENMEYEYHSEKSIGRNPTVDVVFFIKEQTRSA